MKSKKVDWVLRSSATGSNCITLPLPGAAPLCVAIATKYILEGAEVVQGLNPEMKLLEECKSIMARDYENQFPEIKVPAEPETVELGPFYEIDLGYPGIRQLHQSPDVFAVDDFLSPGECGRIVANATPHLAPCMIKNESTGAVERDPSRTSMDVNLPQPEAPSIVSKLAKLATCDADRLEIFQVLRYEQFKQSNRLVTIFCYLNDVELLAGARVFLTLDWNSAEEREDEQTLHEGKAAIDEKWLLATCVWSKEQSEGQYNEANLSLLSSDKI
ncbi:LOW QUALITY PROTEIN: hypothetical protein ACHAWF_011597 [Thalassiosira exigua]